MNSEWIEITGLELRTHIGVPKEERASEQKLLCDLEVTGNRSFAEMDDHVENTIDYHAVCLRLEEVAAARPRKLIETLASEIADVILGEFGARSVSVRIRKFILPQTESVAVRLVREQL